MRLTRLVAVALIGALAGCTAAAPPSPESSPSASRTTAPAPSSSPTLTPTPTGTTVEDCAARTVAAMSLDEQVGQLFMMGVHSASPSEISTLKRLHIGSAILMGRWNGGTSATAQGTRRLTWKGNRVPTLVATDQEGGLVQRLTGPGFSTIPSARRQAALSDATLTARATQWGQQLRAAGVRMTLAPVADVVPPSQANSNAPIGKLGRGYGSDPAVVARKVLAFIAGMDAAGVAGSVKHFPGIGRVRGNTDFTSGVVDKVTTAGDPYLDPFRQAADAGVGSIMISTVTYTRIDPLNLAVNSPAVIGILRDRFDYDGVLITDDLGAAASMKSVPVRDRGTGFIRAGGDLVINVSPGLMAAMVSGVRKAARQPAFRQRITESATRVVRLKENLGLFRC